MVVVRCFYYALCALAITVSFCCARTAYAQAIGQANFLEAAGNIETSKDDLELYILPLNAQQLSQLAEVWQGHLQSVIAENVAANLALKQAEAAEAVRIRAELVDITVRQIHINENYSLVLDMWVSRGGSDEDLSQHRAFDTSLTAEVLLQSEEKTILQLLWAWATSSGGLIRHLWTTLGVVAALLAIFAFASLVRFLIERGLNRVTGPSKSQRKLFGSLVFWGTFGLGFVLVMGFLGFSVTGVFAIVGGISLILGLALQETIGNLASGLMLIFLRPIDIGDYVIAAGSEGTVQDVGLFSTKIRAFDNSLLVIPNGRLWSDTIRNVEANKVRRVELRFTIANNNDFDSVRTILTDIASAHANCLQKPPPTVYISQLDEQLMTIMFWVWVKTPDHWATFTELSELIQKRCNAATMLEPVYKADIRMSPHGTD